MFHDSTYGLYWVPYFNPENESDKLDYYGHWMPLPEPPSENGVDYCTHHWYLIFDGKPAKCMKCGKIL